MTDTPSIDRSGDHRFSFLSWNPDPIDPADRIPVTVFSGFLGSGKTTLLKHLLTERPEGRFALVINDVGEVNIDASDLRRNFPEGQSGVQMLSELTQGCICCSIGDELADALVYLLENNRPSHVLIEASGVANPRNILQTFYIENFAGHGLLEAFQLNNLITVVDVGAFYQEWTRALNDKSRRRRIFLNDPRRPYIELILEQIETCDVMVLNKIDRLSKDELKEIDGILADLNPRADRFSCAEGRLGPGPLLDHARFDLHATQKASITDQHLEQLPEDKKEEHHGHESDHDHHHHPSHGLDTVIFRARRPANGTELFRILRSQLPGVVRAKGFYWTADKPEQCGILSLAGGVLRADWAGPWFIDLWRRGRVELDDMPPHIQTAWEEPPLGDRRQEIVLIGVDLDQEEILAKLNNCLLDLQPDTNAL